MEICDFSSVMKIIREYISDSRAIGQSDLLYVLFATFMEDPENADFDFDNVQVCRWMNGQAAVSPKICKYYQDNQLADVLTGDVLRRVIPLFYDEYMCAEKLHNLLMLDDTISGIAKANICGEFPYSNDEQIASFIGRLIHFIQSSRSGGYATHG